MRRIDNYLKNETDQPVQNGKVQIPPFDKMCLHFVIPLVSFYAVIGLLLYRPAQRLNRLISESMSSSDLLHE